MDKAIQAVSAAFGAAVGGFLYTYLIGKQVPDGLAKVISVGVGSAVAVLTEQGAVFIAKRFIWSRSLLDPRSVYHGVWLEDFEGRNPDRPYSLIWLIYDMDSKQYKVNGVPFDAQGNPVGEFHIDLVALDLHSRKVEGVYASDILVDQRPEIGNGVATVTFAGATQHCLLGRGRLFGREDGGAALQFGVIRVTPAFVQDELRLRDLVIGRDLDLDIHAQRRIIQAYHNQVVQRAVHQDGRAARPHMNRQEPDVLDAATGNAAAVPGRTQPVVPPAPAEGTNGEPAQ